MGVITNVRPDHLAEMGPSLKNVALSMSNTIPQNSKVVLGEDNFSEEFETVAFQRDTEVETVRLIQSPQKKWRPFLILCTLIILLSL